MSTLASQEKLDQLKSARVELINVVTDKIYDLTNQLYEQLFDEEDFSKTKKQLLETIKKIKPNDFKSD